MRRALPTSEERKKERHVIISVHFYLQVKVPSTSTPTSYHYVHGSRLPKRRREYIRLWSIFPLFLSSGGKSRQKKKRHEDASTPSSSRRRRRPRDDDDDRVARVSRHGAAFRAVRDRGTACGAHLFFFFFFASSRFGCVFLSLFRAPSSPRVARRTVAISVVWKAFSTRNKVSCFPTRGVNSRYHHHHLSLYMYI